MRCTTPRFICDSLPFARKWNGEVGEMMVNGEGGKEMKLALLFQNTLSALTFELF